MILVISLNWWILIRPSWASAQCALTNCRRFCWLLENDCPDTSWLACMCVLVPVWVAYVCALNAMLAHVLVRSTHSLQPAEHHEPWCLLVEQMSQYQQFCWSGWRKKSSWAKSKDASMRRSDFVCNKFQPNYIGVDVLIWCWYEYTKSTFHCPLSVRSMELVASFDVPQCAAAQDFRFPFKASHISFLRWIDWLCFFLYIR